MKSYTPVISLLCLLFFSCKKDYQPNTHTTITGRFYDTINKEAYPNIAVKVGEYQSHFDIEYGTVYRLKDYVGSGITDANGNYNISFNTTGKGNFYFLEWGNTPADVKIVNNDKNSTNGNNQSKLINSIGGTPVLNINVSKQYYMRTRIVVHNNPIQPVWISVNDPKWSVGFGSIYGINNDTVIIVPIVKNANFSLAMDIYDKSNQKAYFNNPAILFNNPVITTDTLQGGTYDVYPATFK